MTESLITKYRPISFEEVYGNSFAVQQLKNAIDGASCPKSFLFSGPSGVGKTTLARIVGKYLGAAIQEMDGATRSGVDDARFLTEISVFTPVISDKVLYIIDECHALTKPAWQALLKLIEEPPKHLYIALCTTEMAKVPETIKTRCHPVQLQRLKSDEMQRFLDDIIQLEGYQVENDVFNAIVVAATGQPRKALSILQAGHAAKSVQQLSEVVADVEVDSAPVAEVCNYLLKGGTSWKKVAELLSRVDEADKAYDHACSYIVSRQLNSDDKTARVGAELLDCLTLTRATYDKKVQLVAGISGFLFGRVLNGQG